MKPTFERRRARVRVARLLPRRAARGERRAGRRGTGQVGAVWVRAPAAASVVALALALSLLWPGGAHAQSAPSQPPSLVSLVATVIAATGLTGPTPTGSVTFTVDLKAVASISLLNGVAHLSTALLGPGAHTVVATYSGDGSHAPGVSVSTLPASAGELQLTIAVNPTSSSAPVVTIISPADGAHYAAGQSVQASYTCSDSAGGSDVVRCDGPVPVGSPIDTATAGPHSFGVAAVDRAGHAASGAATYVVDVSAGVSGQAPSGRPAPPAAPLPAAVVPAIAPRPVVPIVVPSGVPAAPRAAARRRPGSPHARSRRRRPVRRPVAVARPRPTLLRYDARSEPAKVVGVEVTAFALLTVLGSGGLGLAGAAAARQASHGGGAGAGAGGGAGGASFDVDYEGVDVAYLLAAGGVALGDRSRTWRWPGTAALDAASVALPARLATRSPLLARIAADGAYLRSVLGSAALLAQVGGVVLGALAVAQTGGRALPPGLVLTVAIAALGVMDAGAGFLAVVTFVTGVALLGGLDSAAAVRTLLGLCALWFVVPVLAGAARPLRRPPPVDAKERFDRAGDFAIASLIGAWAVQKIVTALPGLSGYQLPIAAHAGEIALWVMGALVVRMLGETLSAHLYPLRLVAVHHRDLHEPSALHRLAAATIRTGIFVFVAAVVVGVTWQLWVAGVLFLVPQALAAYDERFPKSKSLGRVLPDGLLEIVLMIFLLTGIGALLISSHSKSLIADSFVLLAIPGAALAILHRFGAAEDRESSGWGSRIAGSAVLSLGVLQVLGLLF